MPGALHIHCDIEPFPRLRPTHIKLAGLWRHQIVRIVVNLGLAFEFGVGSVHAFMHPEFV